MPRSMPATTTSSGTGRITRCRSRSIVASRSSTASAASRSTPAMVAVRRLAERDLPEAQRIIRDAFGTFFGVSDLANFRFPPYAHTRYGAEHIESFAAEQDGELLGSNFAIKWGSVGFFGPLSIRPDHWDSGVGQRLVAAVSDQFDSWGTRHAGLFTFAQSAKHIGLYGKFGF